MLRHYWIIWNNSIRVLLKYYYSQEVIKFHHHINNFLNGMY
jgi:hypothetical protein